MDADTQAKCVVFVVGASLSGNSRSVDIGWGETALVCSGMFLQLTFPSPSTRECAVLGRHALELQSLDLCMHVQ